MSDQKTNLAEFVGELQAGVFEQQVAAAINSVAGATVEHGRGGEVVIKLKSSTSPTQRRSTLSTRCRTSVRPSAAVRAKT